MSRLTDEHIKKAGVSARDKVGSIPSASLKHNGNGLRPFFVGLGDTPIPALGLHRVRQHIEHPLIAEPLHHIPHRRLYIEAVVMVVTADRFFNRLFAGDVGAVGGNVLISLTMLISVLIRFFVKRGLAKFLRPPDHRVRPVLDCRRDVVHQIEVHVAPIFVDIRQGRGRIQQRGHLGLGQLNEVHCHQNILAGAVFGGMVQNFLRRLGHQPCPVFVLLRAHFLIERVCQFFSVQNVFLHFIFRQIVVK